MREGRDARQGRLILYLDTSALVKLYVQEEHTDLVEHAVGEASEVHTSEIAYLEARCAFVRLREEGEFESDEELQETVSYLDADWPGYAAREFHENLARRAADIAQKYGHLRLRAYDALHLASALEVDIENLLPYATEDPRVIRPRVRFLAFDRRLVRASREELGLYFDPFQEEMGEPEADTGEGASTEPT